MQSLFDILGAGENPAPFCVLRIGGPPRGKGAPQVRVVTPKFGRPFAHVYTDKETEKYQDYVSSVARLAMGSRPPSERPIAVRMFIMLPMPQSWPRKKREAALSGMLLAAAKPDADNVEKLANDGMNKIVYADDKQIVRKFVSKEYGENPGVIVELFEL